MFCTNCGNEIPTGGRFCVNCGCPIKNNLAQPTVSNETHENFSDPNMADSTHLLEPVNETDKNHSFEPIAKADTDDIFSQSSDMLEKETTATQFSEELSNDAMSSQVSDALDKETTATQFSEELSDDAMFSQISYALEKQNSGILTDAQLSDTEAYSSQIQNNVQPSNTNSYIQNMQSYSNNMQQNSNMPYQQNMQSYSNNVQQNDNMPYQQNMQGYSNNFQPNGNMPYQQNMQGYSNNVQQNGNMPYQQSMEGYPNNMQPNSNISYQQSFGNQPSQNFQPEGEKKKSSTIWIIGLIVIILAAGVILFFNRDNLFSKDEPSNQVSNAENANSENNDSDNAGNEDNTQRDVVSEETDETTREPESTPKPEPTQTPKPTSNPEGVHTYKVKKGDVTWKEANSAAQGEHSHLATVNSEKEWKAILKVAKKAQRNQGINVFWIGAKRDQYDDCYFWLDSIGGDLYDNPHWLDGEPSYYDSSINKDEYYVELMYIKSSDSWILNDAPNSITTWYSGKIGYIIETED